MPKHYIKIYSCRDCNDHAQVDDYGVSIRCVYESNDKGLCFIDEEEGIPEWCPKGSIAYDDTRPIEDYAGRIEIIREE